MYRRENMNGILESRKYRTTKKNQDRGETSKNNILKS